MPTSPAPSYGLLLGLLSNGHVPISHVCLQLRHRKWCPLSLSKANGPLRIGVVNSAVPAPAHEEQRKGKKSVGWSTKGTSVWCLHTCRPGERLPFPLKPSPRLKPAAAVRVLQGDVRSWSVRRPFLSPCKLAYGTQVHAACRYMYSTGQWHGNH